MKKIILIDPNLRFLKNLNSIENLFIDILILDHESQFETVKTLGIVFNEIFYIDSINQTLINTSPNVNYSDIKKYKSTQLKVENFFNRVTDDKNMVQYIYFCALFYFIEYFHNNYIDAIFCDGLELGAIFDSLIIDIAKKNNVPVFLMEPILVNGKGNELSSFFYYNNKQYLNRTDFLEIKENVNLKNFLFSSVAHNEENTKKVNFKSYIINFLTDIGGFILVSFLRKILGKFQISVHSFDQGWLSFFSGYFHSKRMIKEYYEKSIALNLNSPFVFYALHMDPEGGTMVRATLSNQLLIIKMLSDNLPSGWCLYVKEHPHQYQLNNNTMYYFLVSLKKYRTRLFYNTINKMHNVYLVKSNISSKEILNKAQAVATINGTITVEALENKIPVLLFSKKTLPFSKCSGVFNIENIENIENAFKHILDHNITWNITPNDISQKYLFDSSNTEINYNQIFHALINNILSASKGNLNV